MATKPAQAIIPFSLVAEFEAWGDDQLVALLAARPDLAQPPPRDLDDLARRAGSWPSLQEARQGLDEGSGRLLEALCVLAPPVTVETLAGFLGLPVARADLEATLGRLEARALVKRSDGGLQVLPLLRQVRFPAGLGPSAAVAMGSQSVSWLKAVGSRLGVKGPQAKAALLAAIAQALTDPDLVARLIADGPAGTAQLAARLSEESPHLVTSSGLGYLPEQTPVGWMVRHGLVASVSYNEAVMPGEVGLALRGGRPFATLALRPPAVTAEPVDLEAVESGACQSALRLVSDVAGLLDAWGSNPPALLKVGGIGVRDVRRAAAELGRTETACAHVIELAGVGGLLVADAASGTALPTPLYDDWLGLGAGARWAQLAEAWRANPRSLRPPVASDGEAGVSTRSAKAKAPPPLAASPAEPAAAARREQLLAALAALEPGCAGSTAPLEESLRWQSPAAWGTPLEAQAGALAALMAELELLGLAAHGALSSTGRMLVAGRTDDAASVLTGRAPAATSELTLQADFTAVAPAGLVADVRAELELLADVESKGAATVHRFSEASVRRAFDAGRSAEEVLGFLERHSTREVPQPLRYLVADLGRRHGHVRVRTAGCVVSSDDPSLLVEILRSKRVSALGLRPLASTVAVSDRDPAVVVAGLREAGYLPAQEHSDGSLVLSRPQRRRATTRPTAGSGDAIEYLARVLGRPAPALLGGAPDTRPAKRPDLGEVVAGMRRPGPPVPEAGVAPTGRGTGRGVVNRLHLELFGEEDDVDGDDVDGDDFDEDGFERRPNHIAQRTDAVHDLLVQACIEDWTVRLSYTGDGGRTTELSVVPVAIEGHDLYAETLPRWEARVLDVERIGWARVLTGAEESALL